MASDVEKTDRTNARRQDLLAWESRNLGDRRDARWRCFFREQAVLPADILDLAGMQPGIVGFALDDVLFAVKERQEGIALASGDGRHLMKRAA